MHLESHEAFGFVDHSTYILFEIQHSQQRHIILHMDQVYFVRLLGCEHIRYNQKLRVQDLEDGELKIRIVVFVEEFESLLLEKVFN